jgi:heat-inducible transcriptional repressor
VFDPGRAIGVGELSKATELLNDWLGGISLTDAERVLRTRLRSLRKPPRDVLRGLLKSGSRVFGAGHGEWVHYEGARHIFRHPEFSSDAASLGRILDSEQALADLVSSPLGRGAVEVKIGSENQRREMQKMSLVIGSYRVGGTLGRIGVIGPTRMRYSRLVGLIGHFSRMLDEEASAS